MPEFLRERPREPEVRDYLNNPENALKLSQSERERLIERIKNLFMEVEPSVKASYLQLLQALQDSFMGKYSVTKKLGKIDLSPEYEIVAKGEILHLETRISELTILTDLIRLGIKISDLDRQQSGSYSINITEKNRRCWINLRLYKAVPKNEETEERYLYIADRYVESDLRGNKVGEQLLKIADTIAEENGCKLIFATLIPEDIHDLELLKKGHEKDGYTIQTKEDKEGTKVTAIKHIGGVQ